MGWMRHIRSALVLCTLCLAAVVPAQATAARAADGPEPDWIAPHVAGQLLVKLPDPNTAAFGAQITGAGGAMLRTIPALGLAVVEMPPDTDLRAASADLEALAGVEWAEPNYTFALDLVIPRDDPQ